MNAKNTLHRYEIELHSERYGFYSITAKCKDLQDADRYATQRARMSSIDGDKTQVCNCVEVKNEE